MQRAYNKKILFFGLIFSGFFWANAVKAVCPICVVAIGAGLGLSRWLGVDDVVSSIWIGALLVATILWTLMEMKKKNWHLLPTSSRILDGKAVGTFDAAIISLAYYLLIFIPLYYSGIVGHPLNKIFGIDKIIFGTAVGTIIFLLSYWLHLYLKKKNNGKSFFPYQKVVLPVVVLLLTSLIFFLLILYKFI